MSEETRKNLLALAIVFVPVLILVAFALWPAPILGVSERELADDLTRYYKERDSASGVSRVECTKAAEGEYRCSLGRRANADSVRVKANWTGCWAVEERAAPSGCITLLDVLGDSPSVTSDY